MLFILGDLAQEIIIRLPKETILQYNYQMFISFCSCLKKKKKVSFWALWYHDMFNYFWRLNLCLMLCVSPASVIVANTKWVWKILPLLEVFPYFSICGTCPLHWVYYAIQVTWKMSAFLSYSTDVLLCWYKWQITFKTTF